MKLITEKLFNRLDMETKLKVSLEMVRILENKIIVDELYICTNKSGEKTAYYYDGYVACSEEFRLKNEFTLIKKGKIL